MGVIVVMYRSSDVIAACLASLLKSQPWLGRIVLVDNASPDDSADVAVRVASDHACSVVERTPHDPGTVPPFGTVEIIRSPENSGFAGGVNLGLQLLAKDRDTEFYWILNPDCELALDAAEIALHAAKDGDASGGFALLGTRIRYRDGQQSIQSDGGACSRWTGKCRNLNQGRAPEDAEEYPDDSCNFISGASMIASRGFVLQAGGMTEDYFLYYEEVDWAWRRGCLPLLRSLDAVVFHQGGTAIGSGSVTRVPSPVSCYFNFRNRIRFIRRHHPVALMPSYLAAFLKIVRFLVQGHRKQALSGLRGLLGLAPPGEVAAAFPLADRERAFGPKERKAASTTFVPNLQSRA